MTMFPADLGKDILEQAQGASRLAIHRLMFGLGLRMIVPGLLVGALAAFALGRQISTQLHGIAATNPFLLLVVVLLLVGVTLVACVIPSLRASGISPMEALRNE